MTCDDITLVLDGKPGIATHCKLIGDREFAYTLQRDRANRAYWGELLGAPFSNAATIDLPVLVKVGKTALIREQPTFASVKSTDIGGAASSAISGTSKVVVKTVIVLQRYDGTLIFWASICVIAVLLLTVFGVYQGLGRDGCIPQMRVKELPFSLGRCQMALWFGLSFAAFCFMYVLLQDTNSLNGESLTLMGISAGTALGAVAIDRTKDETSRIEQAVTNLGLGTRWHVELLYDITHERKSRAGFASWAFLQRHLQGYRPDQGRRPTPLPAAGDSIVPELFPNAPANSTLITYRDLWNRYDATIAPLRSKGFLTDLVTDVNGPTIARWQIVVWTLALATIYVSSTYSTLELPEFGTTLLSLMGISSGVYLGFKVPEKQVSNEQAENPESAAKGLPSVVG
ncbi:hypothetical protein [Paraburkholderia graminis]|uniref:hypothetical protein n=1 Tax=Paraburkholderia graminis TaxID=60548 RepID=UPI0031CEA35F